MELTTLIKSRAHRILRRLDNYHPGLDLPAGLSIDAGNLPLASGEELIGVYLNPAERSSAAVFVTTQAIHIFVDGAWRRVAYRAMLDIDTPPAGVKHLRRAVRVITDEGPVDIPVEGGQGRLRDAWPFSHFIQRAIEDTRSRS